MAEDGTQGSPKVAARAETEGPPGGNGARGDGHHLPNGVSAPPDGRLHPADVDPTETQEWLDALESVVQRAGPERARFLLERLKDRAGRHGIETPFTANTAYINTIPVARQPLFPGNRD